MSIICFASLKGGVGKTSLSVNVSHALAERGCKALLIDLDCSAHASRLLFGKDRVRYPRESELARMFLSQQVEDDPGDDALDNGEEHKTQGSLDDVANGSHRHELDLGTSFIYPVRIRLDLIPATADLKYFLWGRGARAFRILFPQLLAQLIEEYDHIVIDTPPDLNVITRNSIASADIVAVPVDSSEMSIHCLEEIVAQTAHIHGPTWSIVRTMVNTNASRVRQMASDRLRAKLTIDDMSETPTCDFEDSEDFMSFLKVREGSQDSAQPTAANGRDESPIFLLHSFIHRTEEQNRLSFLQMTAFDSRQTAKLAKQYLEVARELENLSSMNETLEGETEFSVEGVYNRSCSEPQ